jgi:hypothetical protein
MYTTAAAHTRTPHAPVQLATGFGTQRRGGTCPLTRACAPSSQRQPPRTAFTPPQHAPHSTNTHQTTRARAHISVPSQHLVSLILGPALPPPPHTEQPTPTSHNHAAAGLLEHRAGPAPRPHPNCRHGVRAPRRCQKHAAAHTPRGRGAWGHSNTQPHVLQQQCSPRSCPVLRTRSSVTHLGPADARCADTQQRDTPGPC